MKLFKHGAIIAAIVTLASLANAQLQFTGTSATEEGAIILHWQSESNAVYEIDYADQVADASTGGTAWLPLYTEYPSHGTNTFIADAGNYDITPAIPHPKLAPMRFYRVMLAEANTSPSNPAVAITSPTNGATISDDVIVSVSSSSSEALSEVELYIDGEQQWSSTDGTNFVINTCEWPNGSHVLFATAKSQSGLEGAANGGTITYGRSVSTYVNVTFNNLITRLDLSQPFFEPALGQTQQVTAVFAANVNWTLQIQDANSNTVRTATGSGGSMLVNWDGTGDGDVAIADGVYSYLLTAQTNGRPLSMIDPGGDGGASAPALAVSSSLSGSGTTAEGWYPTSAEQAIAAGWDFYYLKRPPMPPVWTNGVWMNWGDVFGQEPLTQVEVSLPVQTLYSGSPNTAGVAALDDSTPQTDYAGAASQATRAPERKPRAGVKGELGTFGICYLTYSTNGFASPHPRTGWPYPLPTYVAIDAQSRTAQTVDFSIRSHKPMAEGFAQAMQQGGWKQAFIKADGQWGANDITKSSLGGNSIFNNCNFGFLMTHGSYGNDGSTGTEDDNIQYTYIWLGPNNTVRLSDMDLGSPGTNGLRWMTMMACNLLRKANYDSMNNAGKIPVNENLHLLLGGSTTTWAAPDIGKTYAHQMLLNGSNNKIISSWTYAGATAYYYSHRGITNQVNYAVTGWPACYDDSLATYNDPDTGNGLQYQEYPVYTP